MTPNIGKVITPTATCEAMNKVYDQLREMSISEIERCIQEAPLAFVRGWLELKGAGQTYNDIYAMECLYVYQCRETISRKRKGIW